MRRVFNDCLTTVPAVQSTAVGAIAAHSGRAKPIPAFVVGVNRRGRLADYESMRDESWEC